MENTIKRLILIFISFFAINSVFAMPDTCCSNDSNIAVDTSDKGEERIFSRNLFFEFLGPSFGVGIGYDQRFKPTSVFGFSAGLSFTNGSCNNDGWFGAYELNPHIDIDFKGITLPFEVNAIMGKRASKFELGIGATPCIFHRHEVRHWWSFNNSIYEVKDGTRINIFGTLNIGYRLQRKSGFFMRAGLSFLIGDIKCSPINDLVVLPNISLGYTIR